MVVHEPNLQDIVSEEICVEIGISDDHNYLTTWLYILAIVIT